MTITDEMRIAVLSEIIAGFCDNCRACALDSWKEHNPACDAKNKLQAILTQLKAKGKR